MELITIKNLFKPYFIFRLLIILTTHNENTYCCCNQV